MTKGKSGFLTTGEVYQSWHVNEGKLLWLTAAAAATTGDVMVLDASGQAQAKATTTEGALEPVCVVALDDPGATQGIATGVKGWFQAWGQCAKVNLMAAATTGDWLVTSTTSLKAKPVTSGTLPPTGAFGRVLTTGSTPEAHLFGGVYSRDIDTAATLIWTGVHTFTASHLAANEVRAAASYGLKLYDDAGTAGIFVQDGGNVGIGTTSPGAKLEVHTTDWTNNLSLVNITNLDVNAIQSYALLLRGGANNLVGLTFQIQDYDGNTDFVITGNGKVGIGTTTPFQKLTLEHGHYIAWPTAGQANSRSWGIRNDLDNFGDFSIRSSDANDNTLDTTRLVIDKDGNVGIGDASPDHLLDVAGNIGLAASGYINWGDTDGDSGYGFYDNAGTMQFKDDSGSWQDIAAAALAASKSLTLTAGSFMSGGGDLTADRRFDFDHAALGTLLAGTFYTETEVDTFVALAASKSLTLTAGSFMSGGGDLTTDRRFDFDHATLGTLLAGTFYTESEVDTFVALAASKSITLTGGTGIAAIGDLTTDRTINVDTAATLIWTGVHTFTASHLAANEVRAAGSGLALTNAAGSALLYIHDGGNITVGSKVESAVGDFLVHNPVDTAYTEIRGGAGKSAWHAYSQDTTHKGSTGYDDAANAMVMFWAADLELGGIFVRPYGHTTISRAYTASSAQLRVYQPSNTGAIPVLTLDQADVDEPILDAQIAGSPAIRLDAVGITLVTGKRITFDDANDYIEWRSESPEGFDFFIGGTERLLIEADWYRATTNYGILLQGTTARRIQFDSNDYIEYDMTENAYCFMIGNATRAVLGATYFNVAGNIGLAASGYINWGDTDGDSGYGFYDNAGTMQFKSSGGSWQNISAASGAPTDAQYVVLVADGVLSAERVLAAGTAIVRTVGAATVTLAVQESILDHDGLGGFVGNEHIDHSGVTLTGGTGIAAIGDLTANRTITVATPTVWAAGQSDNDIIRWDSASGTWQPEAGGGAAALDDLSDVDSATQTDGFVIRSTGGNYAGAQLSHTKLSDIGTKTHAQIETQMNLAASKSITLTAGSHLAGGGDLTTDRRFDVTAGISDTNVVKVDGSPSDNEYAKFTAAGLEGRSYAEVLSDLSGEATAEFLFNTQKVGGVVDPTTNQQVATKKYVDDNVVASGVDTSGVPVDDDWARFTDADTIEGLSDAETKTALALNNVENVALSGVTLTAGSYLTGGGTIETSQRFDFNNADDFIWAGAHSFTGSGVTLLGTNRRITFDTNDYLQYDTTNDRPYFAIASATYTINTLASGTKTFTPLDYSSLIAAASALVDGAVLHIPAGAYTLTAPITVNDKSATIQGDGPGKTILIFDNCDGIKANTAGTDKIVDIRDLSLYTNTEGTWNAITLAAASIGSGINPQFTIQNVEVRGLVAMSTAGNPSDSWRTGIWLDEAWGTKMDQLWIRGAPYTTLMKYGINAASGHNINCVVNNAHIYFADKGININTISEGWTISDMIAFDCGWALYSKGLWTSWIGGHADVYTGGVYLEDDDHAVQGVLIYAKDWAPSTDWYGIKHASGGGGKFIGNTIRGEGGSNANTWGIYTNGGYDTLIGNSIFNQDKGIHLDTGSSYCTAIGNTGAGNTVEIDDDGSNNWVFNDDGMWLNGRGLYGDDQDFIGYSTGTDEWLMYTGNTVRHTFGAETHLLKNDGADIVGIKRQTVGSDVVLKLRDEDAADWIALSELRFFPLATPYTNTDFDGDTFGTEGSSIKIENDGNWSTNIPADATALVIRISAADEDAAGTECYFAVGPASDQWDALSIRPTINNRYGDVSGVVPCTNGDIYYRTKASGANKLTIYMKCWGYFR